MLAQQALYLPSQLLGSVLEGFLLLTFAHGFFLFFASIRRVVHMGMGFTSVCLMAEPPRLSVTFAFSHTFLLSWITLD